MIQISHLFWTPSLENEILKQTNLYGEQYVASHQDHLLSHPRVRAHSFIYRKFTVIELKQFISVLTSWQMVSPVLTCWQMTASPTGICILIHTDQQAQRRLVA